MSNISVLILTYNEEKHIHRCIESVKRFANDVYIVDSFSTDNTVDIALGLGAKVYKNHWTNYATQFQWGLDNCPIESTWVMRMDADEYVTKELEGEIISAMSNMESNSEISGFFIKRQVHFKGRWIKHGDYYPVWLLRIWRFADGKIEERWMDEHIKLSRGKTKNLFGDIIDDNLNDLTWWTNKHNNYATREAVDVLNTLFSFQKFDEVCPNLFGTQEQRKRYLKICYLKLPLFIRPFIYFIYRYVVRLGFLDGKEGLIWHFLQGFWYRFLVDAKLFEIYKKSGHDKDEIRRILKKDYNIEI